MPTAALISCRGLLDAAEGSRAAAAGGGSQEVVILELEACIRELELECSRLCTQAVGACSE